MPCILLACYLQSYVRIYYRGDTSQKNGAKIKSCYISKAEHHLIHICLGVWEETKSLWSFSVKSQNYA
jgi:hypothetical protein